MNQQAGFVAIALAGLWIAYLVPHRLRFRQQLLESRADDRFSEHLRVLKVAQATGRGTTDVLHHARPGSSVQLHPALPADRARRAGRGGRSMDRPHAARDRVAADAARRSAAEHARRAAYLARRASSARRRALITVVLLLAVAGGWTAVAASGAALLVGVVPTVLLTAVLALGRRAVVAGARADAEWEAGAATRLPAPARAASVVGRAVRPSDAVTEVMARVPSEVRDASAARTAARAGATARTAVAGADTVPGAAPTAAAETSAAGAAPASTWEPVPVPRPAYTLKPAARRAEPAPLVLDGAGQPADAVRAEAAPADVVPADVVPDDATAPARGGAGTRDRSGTAPGRPAVGGVDLDGILARRRAAGE